MKSMQNNNRCKEEEQVVLGLLKKEVFGVPFTPQPGIDWEKVAEESIYQATLLTAFSHCDQLEMTAELRQRIKKQSEEYMKANLLNFQWHGQVHQMMEELKVPYCILKGVASAAYYPELLLRQMGDIDFLVRKEDLEKVGQKLETIGFSKIESKDYHHHIDYEKDNILLEMHFDAPGIPRGEAEPTIRMYLSDLLEQSQLTDNIPFPVRIPSPFHHGLVMLLHLQEHLMKEGIGIRHLCDWAVFVESMEETKFVEVFQIPLQEMGVWKLAQIFSLASVIAFGIEKKVWMGEECELAQALLLDVLAGGNGGSKDNQRLYEGMFINDSRKLGFQKGRIHQVLESASQIAYGNWPLMRRWKVLLPVGWLMLYIRRGYRVLIGKREKIDYLEAYKNSSGRKELYQQLHVFEKER